MLASLLFLSLILLSAAADDDAYTACSCVRKRLINQPCSRFVRDAVPQCAPDANREDCEQLCCESCVVHADNWPVCRSAALRRLCDKYIDSDQSDSDDDDDDEDDDVVGPKMTKEPKPDKSEKKPKQPKMKEDDDEALPSPDQMLSNPFPEDEFHASEEPYYTPEVLPTPGDGEEIVQPTPMDELEPTSVYDVDYPESTPDTVGGDETVGDEEPPFDATNEGELDLAPARDRPFAPAACECMSLGTGCNEILAAASGVCRPGVHASQQGLNCHFACCRICIVNMFATYCDDEPIVEACGL